MITSVQNVGSSLNQTSDPSDQSEVFVVLDAEENPIGFIKVTQSIIKQKDSPQEDPSQTKDESAEFAKWLKETSKVITSREAVWLVASFSEDILDWKCLPIEEDEEIDCKWAITLKGHVTYPDFIISGETNERALKVLALLLIVTQPM